MEFYIKKNATLPLIKLQVVKDGRSDYNNFMDLIEVSALFFSMVDVETGIPKITSRPAGFVEKTFIDPNAEPEYYIYYQFTNRDTNKVGRYEGQFMLRSDDGTLILPIREKLYINVQDSFIADDLQYETCYNSEFPCCVNGPFIPLPTTTTTTTASPPALVAIEITPSDTTISVGDTIQMTATGFYSDGTTSDITNLCEWNSLDDLIASVDNGMGKGLVTGDSAGLTTIEAVLGFIIGTTNINVVLL